MYGNIVAIHNVLKKNYMAKFSTSSIFKKISKYNFEKKLKKKEKRSQFWGKKEKTNVKKKAKKKERKHVGKAKHL